MRKLMVVLFCTMSVLSYLIALVRCMYLLSGVDCDQFGQVVLEGWTKAFIVAHSWKFALFKGLLLRLMASIWNQIYNWDIDEISYRIIKILSKGTFKEIFHVVDLISELVDAPTNNIKDLLVRLTFLRFITQFSPDRHFLENFFLSFLKGYDIWKLVVEFILRHYRIGNLKLRGKIFHYSEQTLLLSLNLSQRCTFLKMLVTSLLFLHNPQ